MAEGIRAPESGTASHKQSVTAAVIREKGGPFILEELDLEAQPRPDEVLVRVVATGICQTDVHVRNQDYPVPLPVVLGHEGAGVVERVGDGVTTVEPGDHVALSYQACGHCRSCLSGHQPYCQYAFEINFGAARLDGSNALRAKREQGGGEIHGHFFGQSSFATYALATERNVVKVPHDVPLELVGPLGCGFQTGAGAVMNSLRPPAASSLAVFGAGAVGLAAIMAARIVGANPIIAVDVIPERLSLAAELGATHTINGKQEDTRRRIAEITGRGADYVLEITGRPQMLKLALDLLAPLGTAALIGGAPAGTEAPVDMTALLGGRTLRGIAQGDSIPQVFIPKLIDLYRAGLFPFDRLVRFYEFGEINQAVADAQRGDVIKPILRIGRQDA
jgi:aryl-alcohol dehydrogenase